MPIEQVYRRFPLAALAGMLIAIWPVSGRLRWNPIEGITKPRVHPVVPLVTTVRLTGLPFEL